MEKNIIRQTHKKQVIWTPKLKKILKKRKITQRKLYALIDKKYETPVGPIRIK